MERFCFKRFSFTTAVVCLVLTLCLLLAGCSASVEDGLPGAEEDVESSGEIVNGDLKRKIVYTVTLKLTVNQVMAVKNEITSKSDTLGGYVEVNNENYTDGECTHVSITYRIPTEKLDEFVSSIEGKGEIDSKRVSSTDITTSYVDAQAEKNALIERKELLTKMLDEEGATTSDKLSIINEITEVNASIQEIELILKEYDSKVNYSTVKLTINKAPSFLDTFIPVFIFLILPAAIGSFFIIRGIIRRKKRTKMTKQTVQA